MLWGSFWEARVLNDLNAAIMGKLDAAKVCLARAGFDFF
jgi:hypothetical protein